MNVWNLQSRLIGREGREVGDDTREMREETEASDFFSSLSVLTGFTRNVRPTDVYWLWPPWIDSDNSFKFHFIPSSWDMNPRSNKAREFDPDTISYHFSPLHSNMKSEVGHHLPLKELTHLYDMNPESSTHSNPDTHEHLSGRNSAEVRRPLL